MSVSLKKGQKVSLTKETSSGLNTVLVGLGWDAAPKKSGGFLSSLFSSANQSVDCDASAIMLKSDKLAGTQDVIYFGNLAHSTGTVTHLGDNLTGDGDGDDEQIIVNLAQVPDNYDRIVVVANIYKADERNQHFGMIKNAFIRIVDSRNNTELCRFNLSDDYTGMTAMIFGELYRNNGEWKFNAVGQGTTDSSLKELLARFQG